MWCIPPEQSAAFVAAMEAVLCLYALAYDPALPVVCMDEQPKQLIGETRRRFTDSTGRRIEDHEYVRHGTCNLWMFTEPLAGWRDVRTSRRRTAADWAHQIQALVDAPRYESATRIRLVCDNLNTHRIASLYEAFEAAEARRIAERIELVHTPAHGSWLNIAECELSVLSRQCLGRRIDTIQEIDREARAWAAARNQSQRGVHWQFTADDARIKLLSLYPRIAA
ncbi:IS630 family transposase [Phycisphaera mikurensis]|uniref:Putative transposase for insertion sequence element n=1 Tax=Phycisphaera mikurensis (strain NBRC 102666 / KCTC 22515 / FYK2301M01) TaxID=1142394 RepID=I0IGN6_PHYMF|nr:IS630 family transposase [Phycisphaera mikurensis]BAM03294.1 putative transposase for insertion sequence element [Phycisphaera mikurensis NBRC 102666]BAM03615.1 putative transposase for insertion sequence element [Phycisphaera mikurensis NBRC 102666]BAM04424.1 putative transposase for insertion sequence element [Phycisphaera mikurensis NBRC 102666]BAM04474.1 putative transposase for insertion sequence element [Phycisphaera mikurensis NBRC 102666]BAM04881.1 putative transposase for insertion